MAKAGRAVGGAQVPETTIRLAAISVGFAIHAELRLPAYDSFAGLSSRSTALEKFFKRIHRARFDIWKTPILLRKMQQGQRQVIPFGANRKLLGLLRKPNTGWMDSCRSAGTYQICHAPQNWLLEA
jgi:hypothetical protein